MVLFIGIKSRSSSVHLRVKYLLNSTGLLEQVLTRMKDELEGFIQLLSKNGLNDKTVVNKALVDIVNFIERIQQQLDSLSRVIEFKVNEEEVNLLLMKQEIFFFIWTKPRNSVKACQ